VLGGNQNSPSEGERKKEKFPWRSKLQEISRWITPCVRRGSAISVEAEESFEDSRVKLRRNSAFGARSHSYKECRG
jgi:hypothetical protein